MLELFAITAPGLEQLCADELSGLGIPAEPEPGGVAWSGDLRSLYRANLETRIASRVIARLGQFRARTFFELERHAPRLPWSDFVRSGDRVALRVTSRKSKLYHEGAIAERLVRTLAESFGVTAAVSSRDDDADDATPEAQLVIVRFVRDVCTVSIDASGTLLHQRGYRQAVAKAPLRETIGAALLFASGWRGDMTVLDPMCGSGTIPIEAALMARHIAPGLANVSREPRAYAFQKWPSFDAALWSEVVAEARAAIRGDATVTIIGSDASNGAITASLANAARAGVADDVTFERRALEALEARAQPGHLVTNAPYGVRVGDRRDLFGLYASLGRVARERLPAWTVTMLAADAGLTKATGLSFDEVLSTRNGGINVRMLRARPRA